MSSPLRASRIVLGLGLAFWCALGWSFGQDLDPDWKELDAPPPPSLTSARWVNFEVPGSELKFAVDGASISIGRDGVVRYVVMVRGAGQASSARYEAIRCVAGQARSLARQQGGSGWVAVPNSEWVELRSQAQFRPALQLARSGFCNGRGTPRTAADALSALTTADRY